MLVGFSLWLLTVPLFADVPPENDNAAPGLPAQESCLTCHFGIEEMHPWEELTCTDCHGGNGEAETKDQAHVHPSRGLPNDERVLPLDWDPAYLRFKNPGNLRVVDQTCGTCHETLCNNLELSLHGTTAGHLCDGLFECGALPKKGSKYGMFLAKDPKFDREEEQSAAGKEKLGILYALPGFDPRKPKDEFATHYRDLPAKNCVQCHLYSTGFALRGRLGMDGDYRAEGCGACHVTYANNGLSRTGDPTVDRFEPGHPLTHQMTNQIPTDTCTHCHYGDASIGLNFRGLAQLYPGQPAGPEVPGTTDYRLNRTFYINDPQVTPPDVHHERGMHCIDCHTVRDVMGDGSMYGQMPAAVEIECEDCHGTIDRPSQLRTSRGRPIDNLTKEGARYFLTSKVTGERHPVKQAAHVVNPRHQDYNPKAAKAMTSSHGRLECYACHGGWSPNFFGFHFDRNEQFTQLDMMSGKRTQGRVSTQEKVFATFRGFYLGWNTDGMIAPYMVGFSSMGSVHGEDGGMILDQEMPVTANGLSGMTLIHHQLHTTRPQARACADCHRNPTALGMGSPNSNYSLGRNFAFVGSERGLDVLSVDRKNMAQARPIATLSLLGVRDVALVTEPLQGHSTSAYLAVAGRGVAYVDLRNPAFPEQEAFWEMTDPHAVHVAANRLYVADGKGGIRICDVTDPLKPTELGSVATPDARGLALNWPHLYVADYESGLIVIDVSNPELPETISTVNLNQGQGGAAEASKVALLLLPSRPDIGDGSGIRSPNQVIAAVACGTYGAALVDVTYPEAPTQHRLAGISGMNGRRDVGTLTTGVATFSKVDLGSPDGAIPTVENDYIAITRDPVSPNSQSSLRLIRITVPYLPKEVASISIGMGAADVSIMNIYNPPFLQTYAIVVGGDRVRMIDISRVESPNEVTIMGGLKGATSIAVEGMPLDRLIDESGRPWKDISHAGARYFSRLEVDKILRVPLVRGYEQVGPITPVSGEKRNSRKR